MIDAKRLPDRVALDTTIVLRALGWAGDPSARLCEHLWRALIDNQKTILIPAPVIAEVLRSNSSRSIPVVRGVHVVAFDDQSAALLGRRVPVSEMERLRAGEAGVQMQCVKYDAMIAACAARWRADVLVHLERKPRGLKSIAGLLDLSECGPEQFRDDEALPLSGRGLSQTPG